jgi:sporulation protein YlmC with PRC-barrel domain
MRIRIDQQVAAVKPVAAVMTALVAAAVAAPLPAHAASSSSNATTAATSTAATSTRKDNAQAVRQVRASKLLGKDVRNRQGEDLGDIKDLVIDVNHGKVHYVVLSFGGFLGLGDKLFAFPTRAFQPAQANDELVLTVDRQKLEHAPGFMPDRYPDWNSAAWRNEVDRYFGSGLAIPSASDMWLVRATDLIGMDVKDPSGDHLGDIQDVVLNMGNGDVRYAVLEFDKSWSLGDKLFAFPLTAFQREPRGDDLVLAVDKQQLAKVPGFDEDHWPNVNDPKWVADVDRYLIASAAVPLPSTTNDALFRRLDTNHDGSLTQQEARADASLEQDWKQMDADDSGRVSRTEFNSRYRQ